MATQQQRTRTVDQGDDPLSSVMGRPAGVEQGNFPAVQNQNNGALVTGMQGEVFTAQRVAVKRNLALIRTNMQALCAINNKKYVYGWEVNDRRAGKKVWIEGGTIILANDLAREWGNCAVDVRVQNDGEHWLFLARFVDHETGFSMTRGYQQRKGQEIGMKDAQRAQDMIFQIGQSKAIRNVVRAALQSMFEWAVETAKESAIDQVTKNPDKSRKWIIDNLEAQGIDVLRVERVYGRKAADWRVPDLMKIGTELRAVIDNMIGSEDIFPLLDKQAQEEAGADEEAARRDAEAARQQQAQGQEKPKDEVNQASFGVYDRKSQKLVGSYTGDVVLAAGDPVDFGDAGIWRVVSGGTDTTGARIYLADKVEPVGALPAVASSDADAPLTPAANKPAAPAATAPKGRGLFGKKG